MKRVPEPELMDDPAQAQAYAHAGFSDAHSRFIALFQQIFPGENITGAALDLGCGPADITVRFAHANPHCALHGVDGAEAMLRWGRARIAREHLTARVQLMHGYLPGARLPLTAYDAVISNSLLHHMRTPMVLWETVRRYAKAGAPVFVMDLLRPASREEARRLVDEYAAGEPEILRQDFFHSLCAAYRIDEVMEQLRAAGLGALRVEPVSGRHWVASGRI